ncbi:DUF4272 domain-containing protein [Ahniella affigens]|nr:DUF4272 domain-containing protein [Ahniella affigens]
MTDPAGMTSEPITLFSQQADPIAIAAWLKALPHEVTLDADASRWRRATITIRGSQPEQTLTVTHDPDWYAPANFDKQLRGMQGFFSMFPDAPGKERALALIPHFRFALGFTESSTLGADDPRMGLIQSLARLTNGVLFSPSGLRDASGRMLFGAEPSDPEAQWPSVPAKAMIERREAIEEAADRATPEALARKARSDQRLREEGIPVNANLPAIEDVRRITIRSKTEIAWRALALLVVAEKGAGLDQETVDELVTDLDLSPHFTPKETAFINDPNPSQNDRVQFSWRYEAAWTLLWALGYVESLGKPDKICDVQYATNLIRDRSPKAFINKANVQPIERIVEEADLIYRYHWAVVDARVNHREPPTGLNASVTLERHYALNWLIGYMDQDWDDVSTDT